MINGGYVCHHTMTESINMESLAYELAMMLKVEGRKEKQEPRTQAEECEAGIHPRIIKGVLGDTCASCGIVTRYWFVE